MFKTVNLFLWDFFFTFTLKKFLFMEDKKYTNILKHLTPFYP